MNHSANIVKNPMKCFLTRLMYRFCENPLYKSVDDIRHYAFLSKNMPVEQDKAEVRMQSLFVTLIFVLLCLEPVFYILTVPGSMIARISLLAPSVWCIVASFSIASLATIPHMYALLTHSGPPNDQLFKIWAALASFGAALVWIYLANLAYPLDAGWLEWAYALRSAICLCIASIYGYSVNAQQMKEAIKNASKT